MGPITDLDYVTSSMTKYHLQDQFLTFFFQLPEAKSFYLTGGTALDRKYYHHRQSDDLDLFTNAKSFDLTPLVRAIRFFSQSQKWQIEHQISSPNYQQYIFRVPDGETLKIDVVADVPVHFGTLESLDAVPIDSLINIATNKIAALFSRTESKDYIDLYWILKHELFDLRDLVAKSKLKDLGLNELYLAEACRQVSAISTFPRTDPEIDREELLTFYHKLAEQVLVLVEPAGS